MYPSLSLDHIAAAAPIWRRLEAHLELRADWRILANWGNKREASSIMIPIETSSSISVNPRKGIFSKPAFLVASRELPDEQEGMILFIIERGVGDGVRQPLANTLTG